MIANYSAVYRDDFGMDTVTIKNDGVTLSFVLRGQEFISRNFHSFGIPSESPIPENHPFNLCLSDLCGYSMDFDIPILLASNTEEVQVHIHVHIEYGNCDEQSRVNHELLQFVVEHQGKVYKSGGKNLYNTFDEQLTELADIMPKDIYLKTCWNCAFSDYSISGSGIFGEMACFRNTKDEYLKVNSKIELSKLWEQRTEDVQETHLCHQFEKRPLGVGGRYVGHGNM